MGKSKRYQEQRTLGTKAYAVMAKVEGLQLSKESAARLGSTKGLSPEKRRAAVLAAYAADKTQTKRK